MPLSTDISPRRTLNLKIILFINTLSSQLMHLASVQIVLFEFSTNLALHSARTLHELSGLGAGTHLCWNRKLAAVDFDYRNPFSWPLPG